MAKIISQDDIELGSHKAPAQFYIRISPDGPYLVYGRPPIDQEIIIPSEDGSPWIYRKGEIEFAESEPIALCRCGGTHHSPMCDGSHAHQDWNPQETAKLNGFLEDSEVFEGPHLFLTDNESYCAFARFCDAKGGIWNLVQEETEPEDVTYAKREAAHCPSGRLMIWDAKTKKPYEPEFSPSISILEDPGIKVSGPIWVKGGIKIISSDNKTYEIRNRVTLCRCGQSKNKPFCDGTHAAIRYEDGLSQVAKRPNEDF